MPPAPKKAEDKVSAAKRGLAWPDMDWHNMAWIGLAGTGMAGQL